MAAVPYLDVSVTSDGANLHAMVVNRHLSEPIEAAVTVTGCPVAGNGPALTLAGPGYLDTNRPAPHDRVVPVPSQWSAAGGTIRHSFPPHSLTCLEIPMQ